MGHIDTLRYLKEAEILCLLKNFSFFFRGASRIWTGE